LDRQHISGDAVAFSARVTGGTAIFTGNGGPLLTVVKTGDPAPSGAFNGLTLCGVANNGLDVAFLGQWSTGGEGAFVSSGGVTSPVIERGDMLFGQEFVGFRLGGVVFDASGSGRVAFAYGLANGVTGIALATPVPEPGAAVVILGACSALPTARRMRRQPEPV
jgi:hypothetical protein